MPPDALDWLRPIAIGVFLFALGGLTGARAMVKRVLTGTLFASLDERYVTRKEHDAHLQHEEEEHQRLRDAVGAVDRFGETLRQQSAAIAGLTVGVAAVGEAVDDLQTGFAREVGHLRKDIRHLRGTGRDDADSHGDAR